MDLSLARAGRYARAAERWARLLVLARVGGRGSRLLRPRRRSRARGTRGGRDGQDPEARRALPEHAGRVLAPLPRLELAPARPRPAAHVGAPARDPGRGQPGRRRVSGLGRRRDPSHQRPHATAAARSRPRRVPERVRRGGRRTACSGSRAGRARCSRTRWTSTGSRRLPRRPTAARCCCWAGIRRRSTGSSSRCERSPRSSRASTARSSSSPGGWWRRSSRWSKSWG